MEPFVQIVDDNIASILNTRLYSANLIISIVAKVGSILMLKTNMTSDGVTINLLNVLENKSIKVYIQIYFKNK